jgi:predicted  nucleic acid-binding Zn-ribbon protein
MQCTRCGVRYKQDPIFEQCPACGKKDFRMTYEAMLTAQQVDAMIKDMERFPFHQFKRRLK